jgi:hypothetical protein
MGASTLALLLALAASPAEEKSETPAAEEAAAFWLPSHAQLQYAGNIGWLSAGPGWSVWERRIQLSFLLGHVPTFAGGPITSVAGKLSLWPFEIDLGEGFYTRPFQAGMLMHYTFGEEYFTEPPGRYREGYYDYPTSLRYAAFAGGSVGAEMDFGLFERIELYGEVGATDLEVYVWLDNPRSRSFFSTLHLAVGTLLWF